MPALSIKLDKRVCIQQKARLQDEYGEVVETWTPFGTVWAAIEAMSGRQYFAAQAVQNPVQTQITIRYMAGIVPSMRIVHDSDIYDIAAVLGQDRRTLLLMCSRGVGDG